MILCWYLKYPYVLDNYSAQVFLKPLKTKKDTEILSKKADLFARYLQWRNCPMRRTDEVVQEVVQEVEVMPQFPVLVEDKDEQHDKNEACIAAMMLLNDYQYTEDTEELYQTDTV